jgi:hypothetical protein
MKSHLARKALLAAFVALLTAGCATQNPPPMEGGMRMQMDQQMDMMKQMHEKMAAAKSDAERHALMSEHIR